MSALDGLVKESVRKVLNELPLGTKAWMVGYGDDKRMREVYRTDNDLCVRLGIRQHLDVPGCDIPDGTLEAAGYLKKVVDENPERAKFLKEFQW